MHLFGVLLPALSASFPSLCNGSDTGSSVPNAPRDAANGKGNSTQLPSCQVHALLPMMHHRKLCIPVDTEPGCTILTGRGGGGGHNLIVGRLFSLLWPKYQTHLHIYPDAHLHILVEFWVSWFIFSELNLCSINCYTSCLSACRPTGLPSINLKIIFTLTWCHMFILASQCLYHCLSYLKMH